MNALEALRQFTIVVADTGSFESMRAYTPQDATTNPSLILKAVEDPRYARLVEEARGMDDWLNALLVMFGVEILRIIPGRVSTEVDARLSFNTQGTITQAQKLVTLYAEHGISSDRVLIKIAATWEGIRAAEILEREGIHCNLTLIFSMVQAQACAEAGVTLISPFVGRISDWHKARGMAWEDVNEDPGVLSVRKIFEAFRLRNVSTEVMGASFRSTAQVLALAGCDLLTVSPELLSQLQSMTVPDDFQPALSPRPRAKVKTPVVWSDRPLEAALFRFMMNEDAMATEKLAEGIRVFARDGDRLTTQVN